MNWLPPYGAGDTKVLYEGSGRLTNVAYSADGKTMFVADGRQGVGLASGVIAFGHRERGRAVACDNIAIWEDERRMIAVR